MQLFAALGKGSGESDRVVTLEVQLEQERLDYWQKVPFEWQPLSKRLSLATLKI
jgi:hypothetical protein